MTTTSRRPRLAWLTLSAALLAAGLIATTAVAATSATSADRASSGNARLTWTTTTRHISSGGRRRTYLVAVPSPRPTGTVPVVVVLHGVDATPQLEEKRTDFPAAVGPAILVYPAGYDESWNAGGCCGHAQRAGIDDVSFIDAVVHQVVAQHATASARQVYLVGYSNGGRMAWDLACRTPSVFAAVGVYGAVPAAPCPTRKAIPAIEVAGVTDPEVAIGGSKAAPVLPDGYHELTVDALVARLRTADGCGGKALVARRGRETTTTWAHCGTGEKVALATYRDQDHSWPGRSATAPSAEQVIWDFFRSVGAR
jgi:polyhydroxybutyrate depolymerase